jgi:NAD(P)-dependent dehydrogenase (short-subunit alcohol dehydrogenase family)
VTVGAVHAGPGARSAHPASAVVTGAAVGIGRGIAECLLADGLTVIGLDRDRDALDAATATLGASFVPCVGDISIWGDHERAADLAEQHGRLAGWVNNAGIDWVAGAREADQAHIDHGLVTLLNGPMYGAAVAVRRMVATRGGSIVNIASIQGVRTFPRYYVYGAAKAGLLQATRSIAVDYAPFGIRCNAILPGTIETPMTYTTLPPDVERDEALRREGELSPMNRIGQPGEIGEVAAFLISDRASYVTGAEIPVDGGAIARCLRYPEIDIDRGE